MPKRHASQIAQRSQGLPFHGASPGSDQEAAREPCHDAVSPAVPLTHAVPPAHGARKRRFGRKSLFGRRGLARRAVTLCGVLTGLAFITILVGGLFYLRIGQRPVLIESLGPRIASALDDRFGHGYRFFLGPTTLTRHGLRPTLSLDGFSLREATGDKEDGHDESRETSGNLLLSAPRAEVSIDSWPLLLGKVVPKRLEIFDVVLHLSVTPEGTLALASETHPDAPVVITPTAPPSTADVKNVPPQSGTAGAAARPVLVKQMGSAIRLLVDTLTNPESPIAAIDKVGITNGRLIVDDRTSNQTLTFENVTLAFNKKGEKTTFELSVEGPNGRWSAGGVASGTPNAPRRLEFQLDHLSLDEILLATGVRLIGADFDTPIAAGFTLALGADDKLLEASGHVDLSPGFVRLDDPDAEPMLVDRLDSRFHWDQTTRRVLIDEARLDAGPSHFSFGGAMALPRIESEPWTLFLKNLAPVIYGPERPKEQPIVLDDAQFTGRLMPSEKKFILDRFAINSANNGGLAMAGTLDWIDGPHLRLGASINPTPVHTALRLWPSFITAPIRAWSLAHMTEGTVQSGTMQLDYDADTLKALRAEQPIPDSAALLDFTITKAAMEFLPGVPALRNIEGTGHITGRTALITLGGGFIETANGQRLLVSDGSFKVEDFAIKPVPAVVAAKISGPAEVVGDLLSREALKAYATLPLDPTTIRGQIDGKMQLDMKIGPETGPGDTVLHVNAMVNNFSVDRLLGKEKLENATLAVIVEPEGLKATGQGHLFGAQATLDMTRAPGKPAEINASLALDEAARAKMGMSMQGLTGTIGAHLATTLANGEKLKGQVELDLTKAGIDGLLPGVSKPLGKPAKINLLAIINDEGLTLDQIVVDAGPLQAKGSIDLNADMGLIGGKFGLLRVSPGDDMKAELLRTGDTLKVIMRATTLDARPFLKNIVSSPPESGPLAAPSLSHDAAKDMSASIKTVDIDLKADVLTGYNKQVLSGADLHLVKQGDDLKQFSCAGRFGRDTIAGNLTPGNANPGSGAPQLSLSTQNAGALLSFIDLYKHMERGRLGVTLRFNGETLAGALMIDNFLLRDEPAMRRLVSEAVDQEKGANQRNIDANAVSFHKLQVRFQRSGTRLDLQEGTMYGDAIGLTVDGWLDYVHDRVDMHGTFVPAFAVNNLFSQIPVFGILLGGGANEGLFGINYRISGAASAPTLSVNPLSAIAPGFLRQMFGVGDQMPAIGQP
ncbi:DUF3971 domain-containing protein [Beijerinckia indica]|nr:DUF3971 domain-containing protein [Beijerinckia indica]